MKRLMNFKWAILLLGLNILSALYFMLILPVDARVPMHWNLQGQIDGWASKSGALLFSYGFAVGLFLLMYLMPFYSPWYKKYQDRMEKIVPGITSILLLFMGALNFYAMWIAKSGFTESSVNMVMILIGALFILIGNILPKVPKNFFIGIKTPWTLTNEEIWYKTHRLGGMLFVLSGIMMILKGLILTQHRMFQEISGGIALIILLFPLLYSFILYRQKAK